MDLARNVSGFLGGALRVAGLYLLGFLRLEGIKPEDSLGVGRVLIAALFLTFSISLLPGLFGASLGNVEAFIPVQAKGVALLGGPGEPAAPVWMKNQYKEALAQARAENKLVFINFTGYACTNCHWMKANMFPRPEITGLLKNFVLVDLYTDGTDAPPSRISSSRKSASAPWPFRSTPSSIRTSTPSPPFPASLAMLQNL